MLDEAGERVQQGRLSRAGAARDDDVQPGLHGRLQQQEHLGREGLEPQQVVLVQRLRAEHADRQHRRRPGPAAG